MKVFSFIGDAGLDYRHMIKEQSDFYIGDTLIEVKNLVIAEQTHSSYVHKCSIDDCGAGIGDHPQIAIADGLMTNIPSQILLIRTADCTPVLIYHPAGKVICALHSGRESTRKNIVREAITRIKEEYYCNPEELLAIIGPGICLDHYEVSEAIYLDYVASFESMGIKPGKTSYRHPDIAGSIKAQLMHAGISEKNIENLSICTYEEKDYFSFRRDGTNNRQINLIGILYE